LAFSLLQIIVIGGTSLFYKKVTIKRP